MAQRTKHNTVGDFGAQFADASDAKYGYYVVECIVVPYTDQ